MGVAGDSYQTDHGSCKPPAGEANSKFLSWITLQTEEEIRG